MPFVDQTPLGRPEELRQTIAFLNFGGPETAEAVEPFLYSLFDDPSVIRLPGGLLLQHRFASLIAKRRAPRVIEQYEKIGFSPLVRTTLAQARALRASLGPDAPEILVGMRYTEPSISKVAEAIAKSKPDRIVAIALFPHFSQTTTGSAFDLLSDELAARDLGGIPVHHVPAFYEHPSYLSAMKGLIAGALAKLEDAHLLFSAHGLPSSYYRSGDPYPAQIHESVRLLVRALAWSGPYSLAFQSRVGPVRWLGPSTEEELDRLAALEGPRNVLVVPMSFTTEGIETLYEIDVTFREHAERRGLRLFRVPTVDTHPDFIDCLRDLVVRGLGDLSHRGLGAHTCVRCLLPKPHAHRTRVVCPDCGFKTPRYSLRLAPPKAD
ncbi:MAG: ferrochelatase [Deltaproteobacteria bacterium]|nr:ferrochelatase [Deltaproteobacteria bacterium]